MPSQGLLEEFARLQSRYDAIGLALASLAEQLITQAITEALPGARSIELWGEFNEDWLRILRLQRVLSGDDVVLFDTHEGHDDPRVEAAIDEVDTEYLDLLLDLTGDIYMGHGTMDLNPPRT